MRDFSRGPRRDFDRGPREEFDAICAECGKECKVPFKPAVDAEGKPLRPVYCKECFQKRNPRRY